MVPPTFIFKEEKKKTKKKMELYLKKFFIGIQLIFNVVLVSGV